jgi:hypothetical protein
VLYLEDSKGKLLDARGSVQDPLVPLCTPAELADLSCDASDLPPGDFFPSPTGGTRLLEGSLEVRFPLGGPFWEGATFVDFGQVWAEDATPSLGDLEFTPGVGIRYFSPIGPIRVDLGYRVRGAEELYVVTNGVRLTPDAPGGFEVLDDLVILENPVLWEDDPGDFLSRFQIHLSIGQAF